MEEVKDKLVSLEDLQVAYDEHNSRLVALEQGENPGQVLTIMQDGNALYNYPAVIDATILPSYRYQQNQIAQVLDIILDSPIVGTFMLPSKTTNVRIYDTKIGEPHRLSNIFVGTPLQINICGVNEKNVFFYCYYANGNIDRYDYSVSDNKITTYIYRMLPTFTDDDNGKLLSVVNGKAAWITIDNGNEVSY